MKRKLVVSVTLAACAWLLPTHRAAADPVLVTSGWINVQSYDEFGSRLFADNFDLLILSTRSGFTESFYAPGDAIDLSSRVVLDDVELYGAFEGRGRIEFTMTGGSARLPTGPVHNEPGSQEELLFPTPFSFAGHVWGYDSRGALAYETALRGRGLAEFILLAVEPNPPYWNSAGYVLRETRYRVENAAPVPERGTLLLLAAGSAAALRPWRRRWVRS
jgi:hypothetical protein